jgi:hypothetical protein
MVAQDEVQFVDEPIFFDQVSGEDRSIGEATARGLANYNQVLERLSLSFALFVSVSSPSGCRCPFLSYPPDVSSRRSLTLFAFLKCHS